MPTCVFRKYTRPMIFKNSVPITAIKLPLDRQKIVSCSQKQFVLMFGYVCSIRRSRRITLENVIIVIGDGVLSWFNAQSIVTSEDIS